jgi:hypothetical protein
MFIDRSDHTFASSGGAQQDHVNQVSCFAPPELVLIWLPFSINIASLRDFMRLINRLSRRSIREWRLEC